jgi:hypothetical protein
VPQVLLQLLALRAQEELQDLLAERLGDEAATLARP